MRKIMEISEDVDTGLSNIPVETSGLVTFWATLYSIIYN